MNLDSRQLGQLRKFNQLDRDLPTKDTIVSLFTETANKFKDNIAITFNEVCLTYGELDELSSQFAFYLKDEHGVSNGDLISLCLERGQFLIIAILGILKAGCAYVPIDIETPSKRKEFIQEDCSSKVVIDKSSVTIFQEKKRHTLQKIWTFQ